MDRTSEALPRRSELRPVVRLYWTVRTAHLERAMVSTPATILFCHRRYDFDDQVADGLHLVQAGTWRAARLLAMHPPMVLEVNEPLMTPGLRRTAVALAAATLVGRLRRRRVTVICYAIENLDPFRSPVKTRRARELLRRAIDRILAAMVARRIDRIAFGTSAARDLYADSLPTLSGHVEHRLIPAVPAPCSCAHLPRHPSAVLFVGTFDERKGVRELMAAWPLAAGARSQARLTLVGSGPMVDEVLEFARVRPDVMVLVDPPRAEVHRAQRRAGVVVQLSRRTARWREQVGLPIVEGLAHGCSVLTTTETGLARWLDDHGHVVLARTEPDEVARALISLIDSARTADDVLSDLPEVDGRLAADAWLLAGAAPLPTN